MHRRSLLRLAGLGAAVVPLTSCAKEEPAMTESRTAPDGSIRHPYGDDPSQYGDLHLPGGEPRGVVVVIHGGFWRAQYDAESLGTPLARSLAAHGWVAWNLEYRRVGDGPGGGGGTPATFDDVAAGIDHLATLDVDISTVVTLGHSAGGHLATWAAARGTVGWPERVPVTHVISQAGVLDLREGETLGDGAVRDLLGHAPTEADQRYDPGQQIPLDLPVWCVHAPDDTVVPVEQSRDYVARATSAGAEAHLVEVDGGHFGVVDPQSAAWSRQLAILRELAGR